MVKIPSFTFVIMWQGCTNRAKFALFPSWSLTKDKSRNCSDNTYKL